MYLEILLTSLTYIRALYFDPILYLTDQQQSLPRGNLEIQTITALISQYDIIYHSLTRVLQML